MAKRDAVDGLGVDDAGAPFDLDDGGRLTGRQVADVGHAGHHGEVVFGTAREGDASVGVANGGIDRSLEFLGGEGEGDRRAGKDDGGEVSDGQPDRRGAGVRGGGGGCSGLLRHVNTVSIQPE